MGSFWKRLFGAERQEVRHLRRIEEEIEEHKKQGGWSGSRPPRPGRLSRYASSSATIPGRRFPSSSSRKAPPPVDT
ncbi:MAG: hypothetical protein A2X88_09180 [Deltaproteobacteria bacterium GWC2_65_14]|nr:MAG: hypothetical protein A2X88_09180 [Deltaproteobacteria bacterium GWC2_65_14]